MRINNSANYDGTLIIINLMNLECELVYIMQILIAMFSNLEATGSY